MLFPLVSNSMVKVICTFGHLFLKCSTFIPDSSCILLSFLDLGFLKLAKGNLKHAWKKIKRNFSGKVGLQNWWQSYVPKKQGYETNGKISNPKHRMGMLSSTSCQAVAERPFISEIDGPPKHTILVRVETFNIPTLEIIKQSCPMKFNSTCDGQYFWLKKKRKWWKAV